MEWKKIESRSNPAVKFAASLSDKKVRDREGVFPAEGTTLFFDFCQRGFFPEKVFLSETALSLQKQIETCLEKESVELYLLSPGAFEKVTEEKGSQGLFCVYSVSRLSSVLSFGKKERLVALERVQDPGNVGTVIRSAAAFGFDGVLLVDCADPFSGKAVRASMGAVCHVPVRSFSTTSALFDFLREENIRAVAACLADSALPIQKADLSGPLCILIGNEGKGLSREAVEKADLLSVIPMEDMESLNAAAAAAIFLWEVKRRSNGE